MALRQRNTKNFNDVGEKVIEAARGIEQKAEDALTCLYHELPPWMQDNCFILSSYRPESRSFRKCFHSLTYFHNETVNIYSHYLPGILLIFVGTYISYTLPLRYETSTLGDTLAFVCFFVSAIACLTMSATYHTVGNHSHDIAKIFNKVDYLGVVILIIGSVIPSIYYGFWCHPKLMLVYSSMISLIGLVCMAASILPKFRTPAMRPLRAAMFVGMGLSSVAPIAHGFLIYGYSTLESRMGFRLVLLEGILYIAGAGIYASRVPERWLPGKYDLVGSSHQIFHLFVVAAVVSHLLALVKSFHYLHATGALPCG